MGRKQARIGAMQVLFQMEANKDFSDEVLERFLDNFDFDEGEELYINHAVSSIKEKLEEIDKYISNNLQDWSIYRLAKVDLSVLRIAVYEILYRQDIPVEVSINEAIEIVKKYSSEESFKFINGILGSFVRSLNRRE